MGTVWPAWRAGLVAAVVAWVASAARASDPQPEARGLDDGGCVARVAEARALLAGGADLRALEVSEDAARRWPDDVAVQLVLGLAALRLGRWEVATTAYGAALALNEESFIARIGLSDAHAGRGRWPAAEGAVEPWAGLALPPRAEAERLLRVGRARLGAHRLDDAEAAYASALGQVARVAGDLGAAGGGEVEAASRSPGRLAAEGRLGLAWVAVARGDAAVARRGFTRLAQMGGADVRAAAGDGLAALGARDRLGGGLAAFGQADPANHALGLLGGVELLLADVWRVGVRYRHLAGPVSRGAGAPWFGQHEAWAFLGWQRPRVAVTAFAAAVRVDTRSPAGRASAIATREAGGAGGLALRLRAGIDWLGSVGVSATTAEAVGQAEIGGRVHLGRLASLTAAVRVQLAEGGPWVAGRVALRVGSGDAFVEGSGLLGRQRRPIELDATALYCTLGHLDGRASAVMGVRLGGRWWLTAGYDWEAWRDLGGAARGQHRAGLGLWVVP